MEARFETPEFRCPRCGGARFSSSNCTDPDNRKMIRHCTGRIGHDLCRFKFPASEDWRFFKIAGVRAFKNEDEYDLVMDIIRSVPIVARRIWP